MDIPSKLAGIFVWYMESGEKTKRQSKINVSRIKNCLNLVTENPNDFSSLDS